MGARLQSVGLPCLIVDKNERVGDNWRHRYRVREQTNQDDILSSRRNSENLLT